MGYGISDNAQLLALLHKGDSLAFDALFRLYHNKILVFATHYVGREADAKDITQEVLYTIWERRDQITHINGYIFRVARNACLDYLQKKKQLLSLDDDYVQKQAWIQYVSLADDTAASVMEKELEAQIEKSIDQLPEKCRRVFILSRIEGYQQSEIANKMDISLKTVEALKKRSGATWRKRYNHFMLDWEDFKIHLDSTANVLISRLDSLKLEHPDMDKDYYALKMAELKMAKKSDYLSYKRVHEEHQKKRLNLGADYQAAVSNILAEVEPNNEKAMVNHVYQSMVFNYLRHKTYERIIKNKPFESFAILSEEAAMEFVDIVSNEVNNALRIGKYIHMFLYRNIEYLNPNSYDRLYEAIDRVVVDTDIKKEIYDRMEHYRQLSPGVRAPQFELADIKGGHVDLDQLKGKYVLIDVWATWCGPCKAEHPYWEQLIEDYNKYDIHFVSVSIDKDKAAWEKMVKEESMKGVHLHGGTKSKAFQEDYLINGIPHYILIDPEETLFAMDSLGHQTPRLETRLMIC